MQIPAGTTESNLTGQMAHGVNQEPATSLLCKKKRKTGAFRGEIGIDVQDINNPSGLGPQSACHSLIGFHSESQSHFHSIQPRDRVTSSKRESRAHEQLTRNRRRRRMRKESLFSSHQTHRDVHLEKSGENALIFKQLVYKLRKN